MRRSPGFTLIEMLVALALVSLMSIAMLQAYRFSQRSLARTTQLDADARDVATAQRLLRRLIEQAYPFEPAAGAAIVETGRPMFGNGSFLELSAPSSAHLGGAGLYRYALSRDEYGALEVAWWLDRNGAAAESKTREVLLEDVAGISIAYLELVELGDGQFEPQWRETWGDQNTLPALVRIRVTFSEGDRRRWPELVVSPRLSADANCVFDVVSQTCRMTS
jgi:general secretion pathway protein J